MVKLSHALQVVIFHSMLNTNSISLLDVVALTVPLRQNDLDAGQVGTIVELLGRDTYEVEFGDDDGMTYAQLALKGDQILPLHFSNTHDQRSAQGRFN
jgi:hypothetical protein